MSTKKKKVRFPLCQPLFHETYLQAQQRQRHTFIHYQNIDNAKPHVDDQPPKCILNVHLKLKKLLAEGQRLAAIERDNRHLLERIIQRMKGPAFVDHYHKGWRPRPGYSLGYQARMREVKNINFENKKMLDRILGTTTAYDHLKMELDYQYIRRSRKGRGKVFKDWNRLAEQRKKNIVRGWVLPPPARSEEERMASFRVLHERCFPEYFGHTVPPSYVPKSSRSKGGEPVSHERCLVEPPSPLPPIPKGRRTPSPPPTHPVQLTKAAKLREEAVRARVEMWASTPTWECPRSRSKSPRAKSGANTNRSATPSPRVSPGVSHQNLSAHDDVGLKHEARRAFSASSPTDSKAILRRAETVSARSKIKAARREKSLAANIDNASKKFQMETEVSKVEASETEVSKVEASETEVSKVEASETEVSKVEASEPEVSKVEASESEVSKVEASETEASNAETTESSQTQVAAELQKETEATAKIAETSQVEITDTEESRTEESEQTGETGEKTEERADVRPATGEAESALGAQPEATSRDYFLGDFPPDDTQWSRVGLSSTRENTVTSIEGGPYYSMPEESSEPLLTGSVDETDRAQEEVKEEVPQEAQEEVPQEAEEVQEEVPQEAEEVQEEVPQEAEEVQEEIPQEAEEVQEEVSVEAEEVQEEVPEATDDDEARPVEEEAMPTTDDESAHDDQNFSENASPVSGSASPSPRSQSPDSHYHSQSPRSHSQSQSQSQSLSPQSGSRTPSRSPTPAALRRYDDCSDAGNTTDDADDLPGSASDCEGSSYPVSRTTRSPTPRSQSTPTTDRQEEDDADDDGHGCRTTSEQGSSPRD